MAGEVATRSLRAAAGAGVACTPAAPLPPADVIAGVALPAVEAGADFTAGAGGACAAASGCGSNTISSAPTGTMSPGGPVVDSTRPLTGAGTSTAAFSVITSTSTSSSATVSPGFTRQLTISASTVPSPRSGSLKTYLLTPPPLPAAAPRQCGPVPGNTPIRTRADKECPSR